MAFLDELGKKAQAMASVASEKARDAAEGAKISMAIADEQRELDKNYRTIGEWYVTENEGQVPEAVRDLVDAVAASKAKIAELKAQKAQKSTQETVPLSVVSKDLKTCPICGAKSESRFCPQCGAPMGE